MIKEKLKKINSYISNTIESIVTKIKIIYKVECYELGT